MQFFVICIVSRGSGYMCNNVKEKKEEEVFCAANIQVLELNFQIVHNYLL